MANATQEVLKRALSTKPVTVAIGEIRALDFPKRRARRLAYAWKGSRRGALYARYLKGDAAGLIAFGNYLVPLAKLGRLGVTGITTVHSTAIQDTLRRLREAGYDAAAATTLAPCNYLVPPTS